MKTLLKTTITLAIILLSYSVFAGETFKSLEGKCKITFPGSYEEELDEDDGIKSISATGAQNGMIYMVIASILDEEIEDDINDLTEKLTLMGIAIAFDTKVKNKKIRSFYVGNEMGHYAYMKPKLNGVKYVGNYYCIIRGNIMYQFAALGLKKMYDERPATRFIDSFRFIESDPE